MDRPTLTANVLSNPCPNLTFLFLLQLERQPDLKTFFLLGPESCCEAAKLVICRRKFSQKVNIIRNVHCGDSKHIPENHRWMGEGELRHVITLSLAEAVAGTLNFCRSRLLGSEMNCHTHGCFSVQDTNGSYGIWRESLCFSRPHPVQCIQVGCVPSRNKEAL